MHSKQTYSEVYEQLLLAKDLQSLVKFKSSRSGLLLYPDAQRIPQFFKNNLLRSGRVIKIVKGKSALLRGFIYQLMKLTFQIQADNKVNYIEVLKAIVFHPSFLQDEGEMLSPISGRGYNDRQYKRIIADFIELMQSQSIPSLELTLMEYPIVDQALTRTLETYTSRCYHNGANTLNMLQWLCQTFAVTLQVYGKCYHFKQPDIFLYEEDSNEFYLAYVNEMAEVSDYSQSTYRFEDIKNLNDRSRKQLIRQNSIPDDLQEDEELDYRIVQDRFRNSAQPLGRREGREELQNRQIIRKTFGNSEIMRDLAKEIDESIHQKPSDPSKSKIGSLLEIMSDRSRQQMILQHRSPQITSSQQFSQQQRRYVEPLTTRTAELDFKSELQQIMQEKHVSNLEQGQMTPQFTNTAHLVEEEYYNPFTKKYSDLYMGHMYSNNMRFAQINQKQNFKFYQPQHQQQFQSQAKYKVEDSPIYDWNSKGSFNLKNQQINANSQKKYQPLANFYEYLNEKPSYLSSYQSISQENLYSKTKEIDDQDLIYRPKGKSKIVIQGDQDQFRRSQDTKGTIYRQFTDTKVLEAMTSFQRMKTNLVRQRFRGVHHRDLFAR